MGYGRTWPTKKPWVALRWIAISNPYLIDFIWLKMCFLWRWNCGAYVPRFDWFKQRTLWWPIKTKSWLRSTFKGLSSWDPNVTPILMRKIPNDAKSNEQNMKRTWSYSTIKKKLSQYENMIIFNHQTQIVWKLGKLSTPIFKRNETLPEHGLPLIVPFTSEWSPSTSAKNGVHHRTKMLLTCPCHGGGFHQWGYHKSK